MQELERKFKPSSEVVQKIPEGEKKETWEGYLERETKEQIKNWLDETTLSGEAKERLLEKSLEIFEKIKRPKPIGYTREERAKTALNLACDAYFCAIPKKIPEAKVKNLAEARKITGIKNVEAIQRINSMGKIINRSQGVIEKAKEILKEYKEKYPNDYGGSPSSGTAITALYIASILCDEHISQSKLSDFLGLTDVTLRKRYKEITKKLGIDIPDLSKKFGGGPLKK